MEGEGGWVSVSFEADLKQRQESGGRTSDNVALPVGQGRPNRSQIDPCSRLAKRIEVEPPKLERAFFLG